MHAHLVQLDIAWQDPEVNRRAVRQVLSRADVSPGDLVVLPEMFDTGFSFELDRTADRDGSSQRFIHDLAREHRAFVIGGVTAPHMARCRNRAIIAGPDGSTRASYDKCRLFPLGNPSEATSLEAGDAVTRFDWKGEEAVGGVLCVTPLVCYDLRFPELFRQGLSQGAEMFVVIANWPVDRAHHWRTLLIARAIENQAFVVGVNRVGADPSLRYHGGSIAIDPLGAVLAEAGDQPGVTSVAIDRGVLDAWRSRFVAWRDRLG